MNQSFVVGAEDVIWIEVHLRRIWMRIVSIFLLGLPQTQKKSKYQKKFQEKDLFLNIFNITPIKALK